MITCIFFVLRRWGWGGHGSVGEWSPPNPEVVDLIAGTFDHVEVSLRKIPNPQLLLGSCHQQVNEESMWIALRVLSVEKRYKRERPVTILLDESEEHLQYETVILTLPGQSELSFAVKIECQWALVNLYWCESSECEFNEFNLNENNTKIRNFGVWCTTCY